MALFKCYECGTQISDKAASCPACGAPVVAQNRSQGAAGQNAQTDYNQVAAQQQQVVSQQIKEAQKAARRTTVFSMISGFVLSTLSHILPSLIRGGRRFR